MAAPKNYTENKFTTQYESMQMSCWLADYMSYRWLSHWKTNSSSEKKLHNLAETWTMDEIESEAVLFSFRTKDGGDELRPAAYAYVPSLWKYMEFAINGHHEYVTVHKSLYIVYICQVTC